MDDKICFVIPIYPAHYNYLTFLNKLSYEDKFTIIFVCTYSNDKISLKDYLKNNITSSFINIDVVVLEENTNMSKLIRSYDDRMKGIINIKKIYGLYNIINNKEYNFHYIACVDCEMQFINTKEFFQRVSGVKKSLVR